MSWSVLTVELEISASRLFWNKVILPEAERLKYKEVKGNTVQLKNHPNYHLTSLPLPHFIFLHFWDSNIEKF